MRRCIVSCVLLIAISCTNTPSENNNTAIDEKLNGEEIFKNNCASCHKVKENFVGPALQGVYARWSDKALLYEFIRNPQNVIDRNEYANKLHTKFGTMMTPFPYLSDEEIKTVLDYCN